MSFFRIAYLALLVALAVLPVRASGQITPTYDDVVFGVVPRDAGGTVTLLMDIYLPAAGSGPYPCVLWIHGGGWQGGTHNTVPGSALQLPTAGVAIASVSYRLSGDAIFPAQIHDVKGAVRFLRANAATYNLDTTRFGSWGSSAGGHLSALLATSGDVAELEGTSGGNPTFSSRVQAAVDYFGPTDILNINLDTTTPPGSGINHDAPTSPESHLVGWDDPGQGIGDIRANIANPNPPYPALVTLCNQVNPITWLTADDPPLFIAHGNMDTSVPIKQSVRLTDAMPAVGVFHDYRSINGAGHGFLGNDTDASARNFLLTQFFDPPLSGDTNCDGAADASDVTAFALRLVNPSAYDVQHPLCNTSNGDLNGDGRTDGKDIRSFVTLLIP
ncbi:MAG TPA: alpha/beta hydrolase fold domain-containing protein [Phycisphaerae bacterium]|nr:alpha/beta hydrolase fold domain-containing protein [Phycisphaerae bacterium]